MTADISSLPPRVRRQIVICPDGCWLWTGHAANGYGRLRIGSRTDSSRREVNAHRFVYEQIVGSIPIGLQLDHLCRVRGCVNPAHLEPVTNRENTVRGDSPRLTRERQAAITHCPAGHLYVGSNLYVEKNGGRKCKTCRRLRASARRAIERTAQQATDER